MHEVITWFIVYAQVAALAMEDMLAWMQEGGQVSIYSISGF
jgi:hypothetical protein